MEWDASCARVTLTGSSLTLDDLLAVARGGAQVEIDPAALAAMGRARAVVERAIADGRPAYAVTTGVGSRKLFDVEASDHDRLLVRQHRISQGAPVAHEIVRATALRLANALARATTVARPELAVPPRGRAERRPPARAAHPRLDRPERPRADGRPRRRDPGRLRARPGRGDRAPQPERVRDGVRGARVRRRPRPPRRARPRGRARSRGARGQPELGAPRDRRGPALPGPAGHARPAGRAARRQRGRGPRPPGPAHVPDDRAAERRRPRRLRLRRPRSSRSSSTPRSRTRSSSSTRTG